MTSHNRQPIASCCCCKPHQGWDDKGGFLCLEKSHKGWRYKRIKYQAQRLAIKAHQIPDKCPYMTSCMVCGHNGRVKRGSSLHGNGCGFCLLNIHATLFIVKMPRQPRSCGESVWRPKICPDGIISGLDMYKFTERMSRA